MNRVLRACVKEVALAFQILLTEALAMLGQPSSTAIELM
jgi:hypothetical protein